MLHHFTFSNSTNIRRSRDAGLCIGTLRACRPELSAALSGIGNNRGFSTVRELRRFDLAAVIPGYVRKQLVWD